MEEQPGLEGGDIVNADGLGPSQGTISSVPGIRVGHAEVEGGRSGCTVVLGPFRGAAKVLGLATGTRELEVLSPAHLVERVNALVLTGGSAFGLAAAAGVMEWLARRGEGFETGSGVVPIVPAAVIFDLEPGVPRPGPEEGQRACEAAWTDTVAEGRVGAGAGATVGKVLGPDHASPGGVGSSFREGPYGHIGALAVVNALGDVVAADGSILAGARGEDGTHPGSDSVVTAGLWRLDFKGMTGSEVGGEGGEGSAHPAPGTNTTLVVIGCDLPLSRVDLGRLAGMAATALPRAITPVNTPFDGDIVFCVSTASKEKPANADELLALGVVAREVTEEAIRRAVLKSQSTPGSPGEGDR
jgi:L-aminopeptidase/D-esterase-like protein